MRIRTQDANGDMTFGRGSGNFLVNSAACVAQNVQTALELKRGEWFLDTTQGTPYSTEVLGYGTQALYDLALQKEILGVPGVSAITAYSSEFNRTTRKLTVNATLSTTFDSVDISATL